MTQIKKYFAMLLIFVSSIHTTYASLLDDSNTIFNWAEEEYSIYFAPSGQTTQTLDPWYFRFYPSTGIYLGVNNQSEVYVLGGQFGNDPLKVGSVSDFLAQINSSNTSNNGNSTGNGNCVTLPFPATGLQANYNVTSGANTGSMNVTYTSTNNTTAVSTTSSNFSGSGVTSSSSSTTTQNYQITDDFLYVSSIETTISSSVPGLGSFDDTTTTTFSPAHNEGPALKYCEQQSWTSEAVSQSTVTQTLGIPGGAVTSNTAVVNGLVEAVNESVTTAAGTFNTVRVKETSSGEDTLTWFSIELGIFVKVQTLNGSGTVTSETELTSTN